MELREKTKFLVIVFTGHTTSNGKRLVELVPRSWIHAIDGKVFCKYPPESQYNLVSAWTEKEKEPVEDWIAFEVEIIKQAKNFEQGRRRLEKSYQSELFSSSAEETSYEEKTLVDDPQLPPLTPQQISNELNDIPEVPNNSSQQTSGVRRKKRKRNSSASNSTAPEDIIMTEQANVHEKSENSDFVRREDLLKLEKSLKRSMNSTKASLQYDLRQFFDKLSGSLIAAGGIGVSANADVARIEANLPYQDVDAFKLFDADVTASATTKDALRIWMTKRTIGEDAYERSIVKIISSLIAISVQKSYSGCGKKMGMNQKENFSATECFKLMKEIIEAKYEVSEQSIRTYTSRWLSGVADRAGGRKRRYLEHNNANDVQ